MLSIFKGEKILAGKPLVISFDYSRTVADSKKKII